jgi:hypothetical protein
MYADPKRIRKNVVKVCLDDYESEVIDRLVRESGGQRQTVLYELLKKAIKRMQSDTPVA